MYVCIIVYIGAHASFLALCDSRTGTRNRRRSRICPASPETEIDRDAIREKLKIEDDPE